MKDPKAILLVGAILAVCLLYTLIKRRKNLSAAQEGGDFVRLKETVAKVLPNESGYKVVCAHYERSEHSGRTTTIYHYTYALAFDATRLWVIPLTFEKGQTQPQTPFLITSDNVGVAEVSEKRKQEQVTQVQVTLRNKDGEAPLDLYVDAQNLKSDRFHHFNINQQEECEQFANFINSLAQKVTAENGELRERMAAEQISSGRKSSKILGILSIAFCWLPLAGIILGVIGLLFAPKPKQTGGKPAAGFLLCLAGLVLSLLIPLVLFFLMP